MSIFSYFIFKKIGKKIINKHLKQVQNNDCQAFNEEIIGKEKYFERKFFVKNDRNTNLAVFEHAINEPKKLINTIQDNYFEERNINFLFIFNEPLVDVYERSVQPFNKILNNNINENSKSVEVEVEVDNKKEKKLVICSRLENEFLDENKEEDNTNKNKIKNVEVNLKEDNFQQYELSPLHKKYLEM